MKIFWTLFFLTAGFAHAGDIEVRNAWVAATHPGQEVAGAYLDISSAGKVKLIRVESGAAKEVQIHSMEMKGGVMKMRQIPALEIPAGKTVRLEPGGNHLMLLDIGKAMVPGEKVPLTLTFAAEGKKNAALSLEAQVKPVSGRH